MNGELTNHFLPKNGIRQGYPLPHYLFVMCIEKLSHLIFDSVNKGVWKPVKSSQSGPTVSHLFFADDLVLFAEANSTQARVLKSCLERFCSASGQTVNYDKSVVFCSPNMSKETTKEALLAKVRWRLHKNDKGLWAKIYESKYLKGKYVLDSSLMIRQDCSTTWKGVMYGVELLRQGMVWRIDKWWDLDKLRRALTEDLVQHIVNYPIFARLIAQGKILSNEQKVRRQLTFDASCGVYEWPIETTLHLLRDCYKARGDEDVLFDPKQLIVRTVHEWFEASHILSKDNHKVHVDLKWEPLISGQFKLNVDGSRRNGYGHIGAGYLIRSSSRDWVIGFAVNMGNGQIIEA
ncbi:unnamed protein product [Prunus armeniaca]